MDQQDRTHNTKVLVILGISSDKGAKGDTWASFNRLPLGHQQEGVGGHWQPDREWTVVPVSC